MITNMKLQDAANARSDVKQQKSTQHKPRIDNGHEQCNDVIKAALERCDQLDRSDGHKQQSAVPGSMQPDPLLLVALHASRPPLLSLDDLLAARCVCKAWRQRLGTAFCHTLRIPHSLWHEASSPRLAASISTAAAAYHQASALLLDAGGGRPGLQPTIWAPLMHSINPWLSHSSASNTSSPSNSSRCIHLHLQAPPSPKRLDALLQLQLITHLKLQHTSQSLYSRHLAAIAGLTQLQSLVLVLMHPRLDLRSLAHQRARKVPLKMDCLSELLGLTQLELSSRGPTGELLPDTIAAFSTPASLAVLTRLRCLSICEAALSGPQPASHWLEPLTLLQQLQLVQLDEPGKAGVQRRGRAGAGSTCAAAAAAGGGAVGAGGAGGGGGGALTGGLFGGGGFGALAAAAAAAGRGGSSEQLLHQQQQQLQTLLPGLAGPGSGGGGRLGHAAAAAAASSQQQHHHHHPLSSQHAAPAGAAPAGAAANPRRPSSSGSASDGESAAAEWPSLPALDLSSILPNLSSLHIANLAGERLVQLKIPNSLTRLALHLANPCPGAVTGEQLAAVVLQSSQTLVGLELGLGMRFSLSGGVMRSLKRGLKGLKDLTLVEGTQDHLEGLGCWCNLRRLELIEGRCPVPLRGLYELSMRAAMGRTPGVLRYCGHMRHVEELAGRLGSALQELRLDSLSGLGVPSRSSLLNTAAGSGEQQGAAGDAAGSSSSPSPSSSPSSSSSSVVVQDEPMPAPPLAQLSALTRLEVVGERLGQLDSCTAVALGSLKQLVVLEVVGQEPWLAPDLGVKEQLGWLREMAQLRQLRLGGVMLGRSKLAGTSTGSSGPAVAAGASSSSSSKGGSGGSGKSGSLVPVVKGLGNGLACISSGGAGGSSKTAAAVAAPAAAVADAAAGVLDPAAAAARDLALSVSLEEVRRWLCQLLPCCRVWLD